MPQPQSARSHGRRKPASLGLRSLAALAALLLLGSSLGRVAHFLLVQHSVCADHGALVELHGDVVADHATSEPGHHDRDHDERSGGDSEGEHEHCQLLAHGQREHTLPHSPAVGILPATVAELLPAPAAMRHDAPVEPPLTLAPKTSPPCHAAVG